MSVILSAGVVKGALGAVLAADSGRVVFITELEYSCKSVSEKTSPLIEDISEQDGEQDLAVGTRKGPKLWQFLGGTAGGGGELDGVEVLGDDLEGVWVMTEVLLMGINSILSSLSDRCLPKTDSRTSPGSWSDWLRSLLTRPNALHRFKALSISWTSEDELSEPLLALVFGGAGASFC